MKEIQVTINQNGEIITQGIAGVMGDHNAGVLTVTVDEEVTGVAYYRLIFAGKGGTVITEQLFAQNGVISYTIPEEVSSLGTLVMTQLYGYQTQEEQVLILFKSTSFPLSFGSSLTDACTMDTDHLTHRLNTMLEKAEIIAKNFDFQLGTVTTLDYNQPATAKLTKSDNMVYTLDLALPKGEKGDGDFSAGDRVSIDNGVISVDSTPKVYDALETDNNQIIIAENKPLADFAGRILFVKPLYDNPSAVVTFTINSEGFAYRLYYYNQGHLDNALPNGCVKAGRPMAIYVNDDAQVIYLNPYEKETAPLPMYFATPSQTSSFSTITIAYTDLNEFIDGKIIIAITTADIPLNGINWLGPAMIPIKFYQNGSWVSVERITDKVLKAGQPLLLYMKYNPANYCFESIYLLNPPT